MPLAFVEKSAYAELSYEVDWSDWLDSGDTISSVSWTVPTGLTNAATSNTTTSATIKLTGGTLGQTYDVVCKITTANGAKEQRTLRFLIIDK